MVKPGQEDQEADDDDGDGAVRILNRDDPCQKKGSQDDQQGANQEQDYRNANGLVRDFWWTLLELQVDVAIVVSGQPGILGLIVG